MNEASGERLPESQLRVGDSEREATLERLATAHAEGRLDLAEFDERSASVVRAKTRGDLDTLTADLPTATPAPSTPRPGAPSSAVQRRGASELPKAVATALLVIAICNVVWVAVGIGNGFTNYWPVWPTLGMVIWVATTWLKEQGSR